MHHQSNLVHLCRTIVCLLLLSSIQSLAWSKDDFPSLPGGTVERITFGSCAMQWKPQPIWNAVVAREPDLFLFLGDAIYGDFDGAKAFKPTEKTLNRDWGLLAAQPGFQIASSTQIIPDQKAMDEWGNYPRERERLFRLIDETDAKGVVLLTGNVHFAELSVREDGPYPIYDLTSSGMTHVNPAYAAAENRYRVAGPLVTHNFGLVQIDWNAQPAPTLTLKAIAENGQVGFSHRISLGDLQ